MTTFATITDAQFENPTFSQMISLITEVLNAPISAETKCGYKVAVNQAINYAIIKGATANCEGAEAIAHQIASYLWCNKMTFDLAALNFRFEKSKGFVKIAN
jgi:hypothetical protein